jgi:hypothetical protein
VANEDWGEPPEGWRYITEEERQEVIRFLETGPHEWDPADWNWTSKYPLLIGPRDVGPIGRARLAELGFVSAILDIGMEFEHNSYWVLERHKEQALVNRRYAQ